MDEGYDFWKCDECGLTYSSETPQKRVRVQQRSERIYGTDTIYRPVELLTICQRCFEQYIRATKRT